MRIMMYRISIIALLFIVVMILPAFAANDEIMSISAKHENDPPILFRGIEWGMLNESMDRKMPDGIKWSSYHDYTYGIEKSLFGLKSDFYGDKIALVDEALSYSIKSVTVAGYELAGLIVKIVYIPDESTGLIVHDADHGSLFYGEYLFKPSDVDAVYDDLTVKLSDLYGAYEYEGTERYISKIMYRCWFGGQGTVVSLVKDALSTGNESIEIRYSYLGVDDLFRNAKMAVALEESLNAEGDTNGL